MGLESALIKQGEVFDPSGLPDYASNSFAELVAAVTATDGGDITARDRDHLRQIAEEAMAGLVAAERELGNDSHRLVPTAGMAAWVPQIQGALEAATN